MPPPRLIVLPHEDLTAAAAAYIAAIGYPEETYDKPGSDRDAFASALIWAKQQRLREEGAEQAVDTLTAQAEAHGVPRRGLEARLQAGLDRAFRTVTAYRIYRLRQHLASRSEMLRTDASPAGLNATVPSWTEMIRDEPLAFKELIALNTTGPGALHGGQTQKDLVKRWLQPCSAAMPLVHGLVVVRDVPAGVERGPIVRWLLDALVEPSDWLIQKGKRVHETNGKLVEGDATAVEAAQLFPQQPYFRGGEPELRPDRQLLVVWNVGGVLQTPDWVAPVRDIPGPRPPHLRKEPKRAPEAAEPANAPVTEAAG